MASEKKIIEGCIRGKSKAQYQLYRKYSSVLLGIALRYTSNKSEAEDVLQEAFVKIYIKMDTYKFDGSFEGWLKRIVVNTALNHNRSKKKEQLVRAMHPGDEYQISKEPSEEQIMPQFNAEDLLNMVQELPKGYRVVFNLYVVEGYTHKEIGEILDVSENTSKTQLFKARAMLRNKLSVRGIVGVEE